MSHPERPPDPGRCMSVVMPYRGQGGHPAMPEVRLWGALAGAQSGFALPGRT